ncbi:MAG: hypothetical protein GF311_01720 [Candidatus Lokiarchaeota archaeon]|nr:hypothetical protein [Candidatus Lokiarchaeota archaeon]
MELLDKSYIEKIKELGNLIFDRKLSISISLGLLYFSVQITDLVSTFIGLELGAVEANPLGINPPMIFLKFLSPLLIISAYIYLLKYLENQKALFFSIVVINIILVGFYVFVTINNVSVINYLLG